MTIPVHNYKKVGKYTIVSFLSQNEVHVTCSTDSVGLIYYCIFNKNDDEGFIKCFNDLILVAKIKTSLKKLRLVNNGGRYTQI